jgi:BirA family biotin operon repressor/biotin-[acetyl-CoA-carboxylase] ligase
MYKEKILSMLRASHERFLSGEELARKAGISRAMVWKHVAALRREGFAIEALPSQGYRITASPDLLRLADVRQGLKTKIVGREFELFSELASTNTYAMEQAARGCREGLAVVAETQTGGKGRLGRTWVSQKGNLHLSVVLRPEIPLRTAPLLTLAAAVAVASAINPFVNNTARIKWPNDILLSGRKAGGLLTEMSAEQDRVRHVVIGIGVNVNKLPEALPAEVAAVTTSLAEEIGRAIDRTQLLRAILRELDKWYAAFLADEKTVLDEWRKLNATLANRVTVSNAGALLEGAAEDIDADGRLLLRLADNSVKAVSAGDVTIVKR